MRYFIAYRTIGRKMFNCEGYSSILNLAGTCLGAAIGSGLTFFGTWMLTRRSEKKQKRALISVGILDNIKEDIDSRLNNGKYVWFLDTDVLASYVDNRVYYLSKKLIWT